MILRKETETIEEVRNVKKNFLIRMNDTPQGDGN